MTKIKMRKKKRLISDLWCEMLDQIRHTLPRGKRLLGIGKAIK
jgi:hypothetical protein